VHRFHLPLLLLSSVVLLWRTSPAQEAASREEWYGKPLPRSESLITYRTVPELAALPVTRLSAAESRAEAGGEAALNSGGHAKTWLLAGTTLVGRATLQIDLAPDAATRTLLLQLKKGNTPFHTVVTATTSGATPLTFTFPGEEADAVRLIVATAAGEPAPGATLELGQIALGAATRIMLLGDSITAGKFADDTLGYRKVLYDQLAAAGLAIDFVGAFGAAPYEGHFQGGRKTFDLYPDNGVRAPRIDVTDDMNNYRPNVVGIFLGTNNLGDLAGAPVGPYGSTSAFNTTPAGQMAGLINYLLQWHDGSRGADLQHIFVCLISPIKSADSLVALYNIEIARVARDYAAGTITGRPEPVHIIDCYTPFYENPLFNNDKKTNYTPYLSTVLAPTNTLHPNSDGHRLIGATCAAAMKPALSGAPLWFTDRSWESNTAGFDAEYSSQGLAVADADGDGRLDLYTTRTAAEYAFRRDFFMQRRTAASYNELAESRGIQDDGDSRGVLFADIEGDGDLDLINANSPGRLRLYENRGTGSFQEITTDSGLENSTAVTTALLAFDAEGDGDIDLYAVNSRTQNALYLNRGDGHFTRADRGANDIDEPAIPSESAAAADFDNDGDVDIYIAKRGAANKLFLNNGAGYFTEGAAAAGIALNGNCRGALWADLDNDADLDLLVTVSATTADPNPLLRAYRNTGAGSFQDLSATLHIPMSGFSILAGDFDLDGDLDLITTGENTTGALYRNDGNWTFAPVSTSGAEVAAGDVRSGAAFDGDGDGDLDFYLTRSDIFNVYRENTLSRTSHFLQVDAAGPGGNASAIGTKLWCYEAGRAGDPAALLGYREIVAGGGHLAQYPARQHFGLGNRSSCDLLAQFSDHTQLVLRGIAADQIVRIAPEAPATGGPAVQLAIAAGQNQSGVVATALPQPLAVRALNAAGQPVAGLHVDFSVLSGDASLLLPAGAGENGSDDPFVTDIQGVAQRTLQLGTAAGAIIVQARATTASGALTATFMARSSAAAAATMTIAGGNNQSAAQAGVPLAEPLTVLLQDGFGNPVPGESVLFSLRSGGGTLRPADGKTVTDSLGRAKILWIPGSAAGIQTVAATAPAIAGSEALFTATLVNGATHLVCLQGDAQSDTVHAVLPIPVRFKVTAADGRPIPSFPVTCLALNGGRIATTAAVGADSILQLATGSDGILALYWRLGTQSGEQSLKVDAAGLQGSPRLLKATALPALPNRLLAIAGDGQSGTVASRLALPLTVRVADRYGNPVAGHSVGFRLVAGGGSLNGAGQSLYTTTTDGTGAAAVTLTLGTLAGLHNNQVEAAAFANGRALNGSPLLFYASASAAPPAFIFALSGNHQSGVAGALLPDSLVVAVKDFYQNSVSACPVTFSVTGGDGKVNGVSQVQTTTDAHGTAWVQWRLGNQAGTEVHQVSAQTPSLSSASALFSAAAMADAAARISRYSGNAQRGIVNRPLPEPLVVQVLDRFGNPVAQHPVRFTVTAGGGNLGGENPISITSDGNGLAAVWFTLGTAPGDSSHRAEAAASLKNSSTPLAGSPVQFYAGGTAQPGDEIQSVELLSGANQSGTVHEWLAAPLRARVLDSTGNPLSGKTVQFRIARGAGRFGSSLDTLVSLVTGSSGLAETTWQLGTRAGDSTQAVQLICRDKNNLPVSGSHRLIYANALPGAPDIGHSTLEVESPLPADGVSEGLITATIRDTWDNPVPGQGIVLVNSGLGAVLTPNQGYSSSAGVLQARVHAAEIGTLTVQARVATSSQWLTTARSILFVRPAAPSELLVLGGGNQNGTAWHRLSQPLTVQVRDTWGNGVAGQRITFSTAAAGGTFSPGAVQSTDSAGVAAVIWYLGAETGSQTAEAAGEGLANTCRFTATALANQPPQLALADSIMLDENAAWRYAITPRDLEGDSVTLALAAPPAGLLCTPAGALSWQPAYDQAGRYSLRLTASDQFGAAAHAELLVIVRNVNRPPQIDADNCQPQQEMLELNKPAAIDFAIAAADPDGDPLNYTWYLNGAFCAYGKSSWRLQSELIPSGDARVKVIVSDLKESVSRTWTLKLASAVWLAGFRATAAPGQGIRLEWQTLLETDPLGFRVERAPDAGGPWCPISALIPPAADGRYLYLDTAAPAGKRSCYRLQALSRDGAIQTHPAVEAFLPLPLRLALSPNYPNPFNGETRLTLSLPQHGRVRVEIVDLLGRSVRRLYEGEAREGYLELLWDGRDEQGRNAASGVYYCRAAAGQEMTSRKLALVK